MAKARTEALKPSTAWGCLTTNLAVPGAGSLLGGRLSGVPQLIICLAGMGLTLVCGVQFVIWGLTHYAELRNPYADPLENLLAMWREVRFALLGLALFGLAWIWALGTSWGIVRDSRKASGGNPHPPV